MTFERSIAQEALYAARPSLRLNGAPAPVADELLLSAEMHEQRDGLARAELRFANTARRSDRGIHWAFETTDASPLSLGVSLELFMGDETNARRFFKGPSAPWKPSSDPNTPRNSSCWLRTLSKRPG